MRYPIKEIKHGDKPYSKRLSEIHDPPKNLYYRGDIGLLDTECFGIVGTRKLTSYGREATEHIVQGLSGSGFTIVSGLAMGIDAVAHKSALDNNLRTIAVLGTGINDNNIYPQSNFNLAMRILDNNGLIITEYPENEPGYKSNFPERNRIISGLSQGVLIIEGEEKSGSLITARQAVDQNRDVFAIPGSIFSSKSIGPNILLKKGAKLVTSAQDILEEYAHEQMIIFQKKEDISTRDPAQIKILDILDTNGNLTTDEIISKSGLEPSNTLSALSILELDGYVVKSFDGKYRKF
jgi:DNA processing protein